MPMKEVNMIHLTQQQHDAVQESSGEPIRAIDPATNAEYVLVRADIYERLRVIFADDQTCGRDAYAVAVDAFARDGWDDPRMDVYNSPPASE